MFKFGLMLGSELVLTLGLFLCLGLRLVVRFVVGLGLRPGLDVELSIGACGVIGIGVGVVSRGLVVGLGLELGLGYCWV